VCWKYSTGLTECRAKTGLACTTAKGQNCQVTQFGCLSTPFVTTSTHAFHDDGKFAHCWVSHATEHCELVQGECKLTAVNEDCQ
jgi:hypothetical protein